MPTANKCFIGHLSVVFLIAAIQTKQNKITQRHRGLQLFYELPSLPSFESIKTSETLHSLEVTSVKLFFFFQLASNVDCAIKLRARETVIHQMLNYSSEYPSLLVMLTDPHESCDSATSGGLQSPYPWK